MDIVWHMNFSKTFNIVSHSLLLEKLVCYGLDKWSSKNHCRENNKTRFNIRAARPGSLPGEERLWELRLFSLEEWRLGEELVTKFQYLMVSTKEVEIPFSKSKSATRIISGKWWIPQCWTLLRFSWTGCWTISFWPCFCWERPRQSFPYNLLIYDSMIFPTPSVSDKEKEKHKTPRNLFHRDTVRALYELIFHNSCLECI